MKLAVYLGENLAGHLSFVESESYVEFLLISRYDRICDENRFSRIHQEDMCQALGILSDRKYQNDGGPGIADIYKLIKEKTTIPLLEIFNEGRQTLRNQENQSGRFWGACRRNWAKVQNGSRLLF